MQRLTHSCGRQIRWLGLTAGLILIPLGAVFSGTVIGVVIGGPMLLIAWALLRNSVAPQPCS